MKRIGILTFSGVGITSEGDEPVCLRCGTLAPPKVLNGFNGIDKFMLILLNVRFLITSAINLSLTDETCTKEIMQV